MRDTGINRAGQQAPRITRVVAIIAQRIRDRIRNDDRAREMKDGVEGMVAQQPGDQRAVADTAFDEGGRVRHGPPKASRQVIQNHDILARAEEFEHHVATDITRTAGDKDNHSARLPKNCDFLVPVCYRKEVVSRSLQDTLGAAGNYSFAPSRYPHSVGELPVFPRLFDGLRRYLSTRNGRAPSPLPTLPHQSRADIARLSSSQSKMRLSSGMTGACSAHRTTN